MRKILLIISLAVPFLTGCTHDHSHNNGAGPPGQGYSESDSHDHDHEYVNLLITAYSDKFEIFAEADPLAQGITSDVLVHVTRIGNFKPVREGKVTVTLSAGGSTTRQTLDAPARPGIYRFRLQPEAAGEAMMQFIIETPEMADTIEISDLRVYSDGHWAIHAAEDLHADHPGAVSFTKEQSWIITFATGTVARRPFGPVLKTVGVVLPAQGDNIILTAQTNGIISLTSRDLYEGISLRQGEPMLEVLGSSLAVGNAAIRYSEAKNNYERAEADYRRMANLAEEKIVSEKDLLMATNDYRNARAVYERLKENFSERGQTVSSPFASYLSSLYVSSGQYVEAGEPLAKVSQNRRLVIRAEVQQRYAHLLENIYSANIINGGKAYTLEQLGGSVLSRARSVSPRSHLIPIHLQVNARPEIFPGSLLDVYLKTRSSDSALVVPSTALVEEQGNYFVYVQIHPESFEKREVQTGSSDGFYTEITSGLNENERIVTLGAVMVKAASSTGNIDAHSGHVH